MNPSAASGGRISRASEPEKSKWMTPNSAPLMSAATRIEKRLRSAR